MVKEAKLSKLNRKQKNEVKLFDIYKAYIESRAKSTSSKKRPQAGAKKRKAEDAPPQQAKRAKPDVTSVVAAIAVKSTGGKKSRPQAGAKMLVCDECDYTSEQICHLKRHMMTHTGEKPFSCNLCEYTCRVKDALQAHMRTHTGEKPFGCGLCDYTCARSANLTRHMLLMHKPAPKAVATAQKRKHVGTNSDLKVQCKGKNNKKKPCKAIVTKMEGYCLAHLKQRPVDYGHDEQKTKTKRDDACNEQHAPKAAANAAKRPPTLAAIDDLPPPDDEADLPPPDDDEPLPPPDEEPPPLEIKPKGKGAKKQKTKSKGKANAQAPQESDASDAGSTVFYQTMHRGKTFAQVRQQDQAYCSWALDLPQPAGQLEKFVQYLRNKNNNKVCKKKKRGRAKRVKRPSRSCRLWLSRNLLKKLKTRSFV